MSLRARFASLASVVPVFVLVGCAGNVGEDEDVESQQALSTTTTYMELSDFPKIDQSAWFDATQKLASEFVATCGDTFCEGGFANLTPLTFSCSVTATEGVVHACAWTFAGSQVAVEPTTAVIDSNAPTFVCPLKAKTTAVKLVALLASSSDALHVALPGEPSIDDQLAGCFDHPIGATPIASSPSSPVTYVAASDYYTTASRRAKWAAAQGALVTGFNNICGDTYCGSDFGDLQSLDFECAVTESSGNVKSCAWLFGGSFSQVDAATGAIHETTKSFRCAVAVKGTLLAAHHHADRGGHRGRDRPAAARRDHQRLRRAWRVPALIRTTGPVAGARRVVKARLHARARTRARPRSWRSATGPCSARSRATRSPTCRRPRTAAGRR